MTEQRSTNALEPTRGNYTWFGQGAKWAILGDSVLRISVFYGIEVEMFHGDHAPPDSYAKYGGDSAVVDIDPIRTGRG
jgi:hypothetical protein